MDKKVGDTQIFMKVKTEKDGLSGRKEKGSWGLSFFQCLPRQFIKQWNTDDDGKSFI